MTLSEVENVRGGMGSALTTVEVWAMVPRRCAKAYRVLLSDGLWLHDFGISLRTSVLLAALILSLPCPMFVFEDEERHTRAESRMVQSRLVRLHDEEPCVDF